MYDAKAGSGLAAYDPQRDDSSPAGSPSSHSCGRPSSSGQFRLDYQPQVDGDTGGPAASRRSSAGSHPQRGLVCPDDVHPGRRAGRAAAGPHRLGAPDRARRRGRLARRRPRARRRRQPLARATCSTRACRRRSVRRAGRAAGLPADRADAGDHREHDHGRAGAGGRDARPAARDRACGCRSTTSAPATARWPTSSSCRSTRSRSTRASCGSCAPTSDDVAIVRTDPGAGVEPAAGGRRRGRRGRGVAGPARRHGLRPAAGLPPEPADAAATRCCPGWASRSCGPARRPRCCPAPAGWPAEPSPRA